MKNQKVKIAKKLNVVRNVQNYNGVINIIGESWYPAQTKEGHRGVNIFYTFGLFIDGNFVQEIKSENPNFRHWFLMSGKEIHSIKSQGLINKTGLTQSFGICRIENGVIIECNRDLNKI